MSKLDIILILKLYKYCKNQEPFVALPYGSRNQPYLQVFGPVTIMKPYNIWWCDRFRDETTRWYCESCKTNHVVGVRNTYGVEQTICVKDLERVKDLN